MISHGNTDSWGFGNKNTSIFFFFFVMLKESATTQIDLSKLCHYVIIYKIRKKYKLYYTIMCDEFNLQLLILCFLFLVF